MSKMHLDYLNKEELEYELEIRGVTNTENTTNKDMIRILRGLLMNETENTKILLECSRPVNEELTECSKKLEAVKALLVPITSLAQQRRLETKLVHIINRLERITTNDEEMLLHKSQLLASSANAMVDFKELVEADIKSKKNIPLDPIFNLENISPVLSTPIKEIQSQATVSVDQPSVHFRHIPVSKWNIKFSGQDDSMGLNEFLERVHELAFARGVSKSELFTAAVELLEGKALVWFRCASRSVNDWDELCMRMKEEFLPSDYSERLWEQIKKRTQGENESVGLYLAVMDNLFNRLNSHVSETVRLRTICRNLLPYYQKQLALIEITTESQLRQLCKKIENNRESIKNFNPPTKSNLSLEIDLAYTNKKVRISNVEVQNSVSNSMKKLHINDGSRSKERSRNVSPSPDSLKTFKYQNKDNYNDYDRKIRNNSCERYSRDENRARSNSRDRNRDISNDRGYRSNNDNQENRYRQREDGRERMHYRDYDNRFSNRDSSRDRVRISRNNSYTQQNPDLKCFRCQRVGHAARFCDYPMLKCYSCGNPGFTKLNCPKCNTPGNFRRGQ